MDYAMINKIEKAKIYAEERGRFEFDSLKVRVIGDNNGSHTVRYQSGTWECDCTFFRTRGVCSHTMAIERILSNMVKIG